MQLQNVEKLIQNGALPFPLSPCRNFMEGGPADE